MMHGREAEVVLPRRIAQGTQEAPDAMFSRAQAIDDAHVGVNVNEEHHMRVGEERTVCHRCC
jgi:hypothetical protein